MDRSFFASRCRLCCARLRRVDCSYHGLGLMEVSLFSAPLHRRLCATVFRSSLLLRSPAYALQSSSSATRSTSSATCCRQAPSTTVSSSIDLSDAFEALLEFDSYRHHSPLGQLRVALINNCIANFDLTSAIRDRISKVEIQITSCIQRF